MAEKLNIAMVFGNVRRSRIIGGPPPIQVTGKVLTFSGWSLVGDFYEYSLYDSKITAGSIVEVVPSRYDIAIVQAAQIMPEADVTAGYVKLYSKNAPAADIDITINIHTGLSTTPAKGFFVATAADGIDGEDGADGDSAYVYIAYASDDAGTDFTTTFDPALDYIAILATDTEIPSPAVGDFAGLWKNYKGEPGADGNDGEDGTDAFVYVAYASDNSGTGFSLTPTNLLKYRAEIHVAEELTPPVAADFTGAVWVKYIGDDGGGGPGGAEPPELFLDFEEEGDEFVYNVPYKMKFVSQNNESTNPVLSIPLNTVMDEFDKLTVTATAPGLVRLYGEYVE